MLLLKDKLKTILCLDGYTAIVPSVSVGNAAQLACDLLISTMQLKRIGNIAHPALIPIFGPSAFQHEPTSKTASCEIYESAEHKLIILQIRSPLISQHIASFHEEIVELLQDCLRVIILSSSYAFEKHTIESSSFEYIATNNFKLANPAIVDGSLEWNEYEGDLVHGGGNGLKLYKSFAARNVQTILFFKYVLEGDNSIDASSIVREISQLCEEFNLKQDGAIKLTVPVSWKLLFGNDVPELIF